MLKKIVLLNIVVETEILFQKFKRTAFIWNIIFCKIIKAVTVIFNLINPCNNVFL